ncbi:metallophosphoesterase [Anthocerotibacter panamensis]|uniref:metallophosphoesterase n=1 Tax=Anthocerotibacter panamensis TaxID=2857077 RepID=UPI001C407D98|nr:metallophosphoesterase [Anthocerotibacter panamensis]
MNALIAIPDIHGRLDKLQNLLGTLCLLGYSLDNLVFLGDFIDRGRDSAQILDWLIQHKARYPSTVILRGNHEEMMLDHVESGDETWFRPNNGGIATLESYRRFFREDFRSTIHFHRALRESGHLEFLQSLPRYYETQNYFFSHAPIPKAMYWPSSGLTTNKDLPFPEELYCWSYPGRVPEDDFAHAHPGRYAVCGHIHRLREEIFEARRYGHITFLDAGCGCHPKAPLAALVLPLEREEGQEEEEILYSL